MVNAGCRESRFGGEGDEFPPKEEGWVLAKLDDEKQKRDQEIDLKLKVRGKPGSHPTFILGPDKSTTPQALITFHRNESP